MIDIVWSEFLFIALLALILIGPKELPSVLRNIGRWVGKARAFAKNISAQLDLHAEIDGLNNKPNLTQEKASVQNNEPTINKKIKHLENKK